jgi:RHH-type rel operon transcriptional repressor/antitoxin RelB
MYSWRIAMPTSIRLAPGIEERLDFLAARTGRSKAYYLRELIERGIEEMEDYYLAAEVVERIRRGEEDVVKGEDFWRGLDA